jgi:chloramphenicol 3-O-phosphotransferase
MKSRIVIINGPAGVGKTTVSRILATYGNSSACIHGDDFPKYIVNRDLNKVATGLGYKNGATIANNFINGGYDLVVYDYIFEDQTHIPKFIGNIAVDSDLHFFTLWTSKEIIIDREAKRLGRERLGVRVRECYNIMEKSLENLGSIIDTSNKTPEEIAETIWACVLEETSTVANLFLQRTRFPRR